jgi:hypothetical protein
MENINYEGAASFIEYPQYVFYTDGRVLNKNGTQKKQQVTTTGYKCVSLWKNNKEKSYRIHRLIYCLFNNLFDIPVDIYVDHIDGNKFNNYIENLRLSTNQLNQLNLNNNHQTNNTSGYRGVTWSHEKNKFAARIMINHKNKHIGYYETAKEAHKAYINKHNEVYENIKKEFDERIKKR